MMSMTYRQLLKILTEHPLVGDKLDQPIVIYSCRWEDATIEGLIIKENGDLNLTPYSSSNEMYDRIEPNGKFISVTD